MYRSSLAGAAADMHILHERLTQGFDKLWNALK